MPENHQTKLTGQPLVWRPHFREIASESMAKQIAEVVTAMLGCFIWATENNPLSLYSSSEWMCLLSQDDMQIFHLSGYTIQLNGLFKSRLSPRDYYIPILLLQYSFAVLSIPHSNPFLVHLSPYLALRFSMYYIQCREIHFAWGDLNLGYSPSSTEP